MKKYLYLFLLPILAFIVSSCDDDEEEKPTILMKYLVGKWEVVESTNPEHTTIYNITDNSNIPSAGTVGYSGLLTTYYRSVGEQPIYDKEYSWRIVAIEDTYYPLIELVWQADIDGADGDQVANRFYYRIEELTPTTMRWHINSATGEETIDFIRQNDLDDK